MEVQSQENLIKETFDKILIKEAFDNYQFLARNKNKDAINYLSTNTIQHYEKISELIKNNDYKSLSSLCFMDKLIFYLAKDKIPKEDIFSLDGRKVIIYGIENGMISKKSTMDISLGEILLSENFAKGEILLNGKKTSFYYDFFKENDIWKLDLSSTFTIVEISLKKVMEENNQTEDEFIASMLASYK